MAMSSANQMATRLRRQDAEGREVTVAVDIGCSWSVFTDLHGGPAPKRIDASIIRFIARIAKLDVICQ
jgi:hypothetical protein